MARFYLSMDIDGMSGEGVAITLRKQADYIAEWYSLGEIQQSRAQSLHLVRNEGGDVIGRWEVLADGR